MTSPDVQCPSCGRSFRGWRGLLAHSTSPFNDMDCVYRARQAVDQLRATEKEGHKS